MPILPTEQALQELKADKFKFDKLAKKLLDDYLLQMQLPNCFGIYGNWGAGKSTLLNFIKKHIEAEHSEEVAVVYFEPWKYEHSKNSDLLFALINKIKVDLGISTQEWEKLEAKLLTIGNWALSKLPISVDIKEIDESLQKFEEILLDKHQLWADETEALRKEFEGIISQALLTDSNGNKRTLVVFIDDLDRCLPESAVRLLESIKNFLTVQDTLFVIAIDRRVVAEMIDKKYRLKNGYGDEYLMKIINYYYELPKVRLEDIARETIDIYELDIEEPIIEYFTEFLNRFCPEPRRAKHFMHNFCMRISMAEGELLAFTQDKTGRANGSGGENGSNMADVFLCMFLQARHPKVFSGDNAPIIAGILCSLAPGRTPRTEVRLEVEFIEPEERNDIMSVMKFGYQSNTPRKGRNLHSVFCSNAMKAAMQKPT